MLYSRRNATWLLLGSMLLCSLSGCTSFQTMCTNQWLDAKWIDSSTEQPINHLLVVWDSRIRSTQNSENNGASLPGVAGRLYLLSDDSTQGLEARGKIIVQMHDLSSVNPGKQPMKLGEWTFPAQSLRQLKRKDMIGEGYTLFLPWDTYNPVVKQVQLVVCYVPEKGAPHYAEPTQVTLQGEDQPAPSLRREQIVPVNSSQRTPGVAGTRAIQPPYLSGTQQPVQQSTPGTQVQYVPVAPTSPLPQSQYVPQ